MNGAEAGKLLELMELAYPNSFKSMNNQRRAATLRMWESSFSRVPYAIIEQCFDEYRMENRFPPTVADMNDSLRRFRARAEQAAAIHRFLGNPDLEAHYRGLMAASAPDRSDFPDLSLPPQTAGEGQCPSRMCIDSVTAPFT